MSVEHLRVREVEEYIVSTSRTVSEVELCENYTYQRVVGRFESLSIHNIDGTYIRSTIEYWDEHELWKRELGCQARCLDLKS